MPVASFRVIEHKELAGDRRTFRTERSPTIEAPLFGGVVDRVRGADGSDVFFRHHQGRVTGWKVVEPSSDRRLLGAEVPPAEEVVVGVAALQRAVAKEGEPRGCLLFEDLSFRIRLVDCAL